MQQCIMGVVCFQIAFFFFLFSFKSLQTDTNYFNNYVCFQSLISGYKMSESQARRDRLETFCVYTVVFCVATSTKHNFLQATGYVSGKMIFAVMVYFQPRATFANKNTCY